MENNEKSTNTQKDVDDTQKPQLSEKFLSPYDPRTTEARIYDLWLTKGCFKADATSDKPAFSMVLPPPNVTGNLHVGHSLMLVIQDVLARFHRMNGFETLWLPGTDHAAIATQSKVEKELTKQKIRRNDLTREEFFEKINDFALESQQTILGQFKGMGASLDWSRLAYTLDEPREKAVRVAFKNMYDSDLLYQGLKVINWDPKGQTVISDDEIIHKPTKATLYTFKYSNDFPIAISTTRPETKLGDTAVAVHPDDKRYQQYIGKTFNVDNFCGTKLTIQVIGDESVDPEFGTGALGVTPAHSKADEAIAKKHNLPSVQVINEYAKVSAQIKWLEGLKTTAAREKIVEWLRENNLMQAEEEIDQNLSTAERTGATIEPLPKKQWFIDVNKEFTLKHSEIAGILSGSTTTLKQIMRSTVESGQIEVLPDRFRKIYFNWIENLHDWCISRQIVFGHRVPVWYKNEEVYVGVEEPKGEGWEQDPDTLDTWFSSGLWTFSTLGWPDKTNDLKKFHPTTFLDTAYDIIFFWVARMVLMSGFHLGQIPFKTVYLHGLVRDGKGEKMSKSLGNIIDPSDMIEKYGADALRISMIIGNGPGSDSNLSEDKIKAYKHFSNKIWNISRFVLTYKNETRPKTLYTDDEKLLEELKQEEQLLRQEITDYKLNLASERVYAYTWHRLADEIIEESKPLLADDADITRKQSRSYVLTAIHKRLLMLLHPFMPFITEEIWQEAYNDAGTPLATKQW